MSDCRCLFCLGEDGTKLIPISFEMADAAGLVSEAKKDRVTIKPADQIFAINGVRAVACVRIVKRRIARLCGCWVGKDARGRGVGEKLVRHRIEFIRNHTSARIIDTYAFRPNLFVSMGFKLVAGYKIGSHLLRLRIQDKLACNLNGVKIIRETPVAEVYCGSMSGCSFRVDMIACDPPWRQGNLSYWSGQAGINQVWGTFVSDLSRHFNSKVIYLKTGVPESSEWVSILQSKGYRVVAWETSYYAGRNCQIVASNGIQLDGLPQSEKSTEATRMVAVWAKQNGILTVADPCVGKGVMLSRFLDAGMRVVGVELVEKRANMAAARLCK